MLWQSSAQAEDLQTLRKRELKANHPFFFSLKSIQKQFDSKGSQYLRKFGKDKGNINDEAVFQHLLLLCFKCVLLGQMLWCEKVHENTRLCKVRKVKTQSAIFEWGRLSSTECEHEEY